MQPAIGVVRRVGEIGDVALQHLVVGHPTAACATAGPRRRARPARCAAARSSRLANNAGRSGPSATRAAPVRVAKSTISSGLSFARLGQRVGEDQPALGVGVVDLDEQALARLDDVAGPVGAARHGILDRRDEQVEADRQPLGHDQPGQRERVGRAAHVLLHQPHAGGRLEVEPAAVEADALADDRDARIARACPIRARSGAARAPASRRRRPRRSADSLRQLVARW